MTRRAIDERAVEAARWWLDLKRRTVDTFLPLYRDSHRFLVLMGGGGSGKSIFAGRKILERATSEPGHRFLVVRKVANTLRESCFRQLCYQLAEDYPRVRYKVNKTDMTITLANGSEIIFKGLDDVEKLKSIVRITGIWVEEASELDERDLNQLNIRLRDETPYYQQIILSFNPISVTHWLKRRFFDAYDPDVRTHHSTYLDNPYLPESNRKELEKLQAVDPYYYQVYALGQWGITGQSVFNAQAIANRLKALGDPVAVGEMTYSYDGSEIGDVDLAESDGGTVKVYSRPREGVPYVIGVDTAGDGSDASVAQVLDNTTGEQVATMRAVNVDEDVFIHGVYALGIWYNSALVAVEANFSTYPIMELERLRYPRQYVREGVDSFTHRYQDRYGFRTDSKTRPIVIAELIKAAREGDEPLGWVNDRLTLEEMATFVRSESWKPEAEQGAHDDCVMALAIANHARAQQDYLPEAKEGGKWTQEMWEDYRAASARERAEMVKTWGAPR